MSGPILITGATGFLGKHLVARLRSRPDCPPLRIFSYGPCPWEGEEGFEIIPGDITDAAQVERAMEGCTQVYHLAGFVSRNPQDRERLERVHVGGTRNVCEAALKHRPEKIVAVSSSGTIAVSWEPKIFDETADYPEELIRRWAYYDTKARAERLALEYVEKHGLPIVVVNPGLLLGPGDDLGSSTGDIALFLEGQVMALPRGGMCFVDARDAAAGLALAMEKGRPGERYLLGGPNWSFQEIIERVAELTGRKAPRLKLPPKLALWSARLMRRLLPLFGRQFKMDDVTIEMSSYYWYFTSAKAARELGFQTRDPMQTLRATIDDLMQRRP